MQIFGRPASPSLIRFAQYLDDVSGAIELAINDRCAAWNLIHDSRVLENWAEEWVRRYAARTPPDPIRDCFTSYLTDFRTKMLEIYSLLKTEGRNDVTPGEFGAPKLSDLLVSVIDLWSPSSQTVWRFGQSEEIDDLAAMDFRENGAVPRDLLDRLAFSSQNVQIPVMRSFFKAREAFLQDFLDRRRRGASASTLNPAWVTRWDRWRARVNDAPEDWCESVGLSTRGSSLIAVVQYVASHVPRLIRPTQLEAGWYGRHFPSPPQCSRSQGGRVVEGRIAVSSAPGFLPLPEFIHAPISLSLDHWLATGFPVRLTENSVGRPSHLLRDRVAHWNALKREFPLTSAWMAKPNP